YLIFSVAIPAPLPCIFIGLFMGLGASFLTLVVADTVGAESGLGWYLRCAQGWAGYGRVCAAPVIMAGLVSTIVAVLFNVRARERRAINHGTERRPRPRVSGPEFVAVVDRAEKHRGGSGGAPRSLRETPRSRGIHAAGRPRSFCRRLSASSFRRHGPTGRA